MMSHDIRGRWWWYSSRSWTFPPMFCCVLLPCNKWQQRGNLTGQCLTWKYIWSRNVELNSSLQTKWHPFAFINTCWTFLEAEQWLLAQWGRGRCISAVGSNDVKRQAILPYSAQPCRFFTHVAWRFLLITGENPLLMVVTMLKNSVL